MPRRKKGAPIDLARPHELTVGLIEALRCPEDKQQVFLRDSVTRGFKVRVTAGGAKSFIFETRVNGKTMRRTIGAVDAWPIEQARAEANKLRVKADSKVDPREEERDTAERKASEKAQEEGIKATRAREEAARSIIVDEAWRRYLAEGGPKRREAWKPRYVADMAKMTALGGEEKKRGPGKTLPGHLAPLMSLRLVDVDEDRLAAWFASERKRSKHQATRALMMFRGFLRWCTTQPDYRGLVNRDAGKAPAIVDSLPELTRRTDALEAAQVPGWWAGVTQLANPTASAYLRALLLTGARREEMAALRWDAVDFHWRKLTIADKVGDTRTIPLTPYMAWMLSTLPRAKGEDDKPSPFVFASTSKSGRIADPRSSHERALQSAAINGLTLHGLRRSFSLQGEAAGAPAGAIAQIMGHRPSATAEGYRPRSVDALRPFAERIEAHILELAGEEFDAMAVHVPALRLVTG
jgi:integrase